MRRILVTQTFEIEVDEELSLPEIADEVGLECSFPNVPRLTTWDVAPEPSDEPANTE